MLDEKFETEVVDTEVHSHNQDVTHKLACAMKRGVGERNIFVQPETCEQGDWENDAE